MADPRKEGTVSVDYVCKLCGSPAEWIEDEEVWRHKGEAFDPQYMNQVFCDKYGYPIQVKVKQ